MKRAAALKAEKEVEKRRHPHRVSSKTEKKSLALAPKASGADRLSTMVPFLDAKARISRHLTHKSPIVGFKSTGIRELKEFEDMMKKFAEFESTPSDLITSEDQTADMTMMLLAKHGKFGQQEEEEEEEEEEESTHYPWGEGVGQKDNPNPNPNRYPST